MPKAKNKNKETIERASGNVLSFDIGIVFRIFVLVTCFKALLIPTYRSTDFEVHRNWLAITYSLPVKEWYVNAKSQWTLDYPPFFAWFEYLLSQIAVLFDPDMVKIDNLNYESSAAILFQRGSVMLTDLSLVYGVKEIGKVFCTSNDSYLIFVLLSLCNIGLVVVDHIHFQYNGFLLGLLLLSIARVSKIGNQASILQGALWFAVLLNLKHIYLYVAPAFVVWLLSSYCLDGGKFFKSIFFLSSIVIGTLAVSFGPFVTQIPQVLSRLFPFKRGLVHAYWAANSWAIYIGIDKVLCVIWKRLGWLGSSKSAVMTGGLVQEQSFVLLPTPTPIVTFLLTFVSMLPALWALFSKKDYNKSPSQFVRCIILCALSSFMFGWHVHEKAILTAIIPLCVMTVITKEDARFFLILSGAGHTALLPLLYPKDLTPLKLLLLLTYMIAATLILTRYYKHPLLRMYEYAYVSGLPLITLYETVLHTLIFGDRLPFLPLALTSIYCAIGVSYVWIFYYRMFLRTSNDIDHHKIKKH